MLFTLRAQPVMKGKAALITGASGRPAALVRRGRGRRCLVRYVMESPKHNAGSAGHFIEDFERRDQSADRDRLHRC